jgi:hypothetical protein
VMVFSRLFDGLRWFSKAALVGGDVLVVAG